MQITEKGVREELEKFFTNPEKQVTINVESHNKQIELLVLTKTPGIAQMLREHFARYTNVCIECG